MIRRPLRYFLQGSLPAPAKLRCPQLSVIKLQQGLNLQHTSHHAGRLADSPAPLQILQILCGKKDAARLPDSFQHFHRGFQGDLAVPQTDGMEVLGKQSGLACISR